MESLEPQLRQLLEQHKAHFSVQDNGKILCTINGHTLPPRHAEVSKFIQGPKFQKLLKRQQAESALLKYEPFIVQSNNFPLMLYCALTGQLMAKSVEAVKKHMQGKKFLRAKERFTNDEIDLKPEPSLESFGIKLQNGDAAEYDAAAGGGEKSGEQQQRQRQRQQGSSKGPTQQQSASAKKAAANSAAAATAAAEEEGSADADEPAFWVPSDEDVASEVSSGDEEGGEEGDVASGSDVDMAAAGDEDAGGEPAAPGLLGDPMEEDEPAQQQQQRKAAGKKKVAAAQPAAVGGSEQQRQSAKLIKPGKAAAAKVAASGGAKQKQKNVHRPSAAKKAKR